jgi:sigma54-dependent transcription regulator
MPIQLIPYAIKAAILAAFIALGYTGYSHVKQIGYAEAYQAQQLRIDTLQKEISSKIDAIETLSNNLAEEGKVRDELLSNDVAVILAKTKGKTVTIVKNGECTPNATFSDTINALNKRANQSIKDSQK